MKPNRELVSGDFIRLGFEQQGREFWRRFTGKGGAFIDVQVINSSDSMFPKSLKGYPFSFYIDQWHVEKAERGRGFGKEIAIATVEFLKKLNKPISSITLRRTSVAQGNSEKH